MEEEWDLDNTYESIPKSEIDLRDPTKLYIRNIPEVLTFNGLKNLFGRYGEISKVYLNEEKHYAFISFETESAAMGAFCGLHRRPNLNLSITYAFHKPEDGVKDDSGKELREMMALLKKFKLEDPPSDKEIINAPEEDAQSAGRRRQTSDVRSNDRGNYPKKTNYDKDAENSQADRRSGPPLQRKDMQTPKGFNSRNVQEPILQISSSPDGRRVTTLQSPRPEIMPVQDDGMPPLGYACVNCGNIGHRMCTPCHTHYCSENCQRIDWGRRHKNICHNLAAQVAVEMEQGNQHLEFDDCSSQFQKDDRTPRRSDQNDQRRGDYGDRSRPAQREDRPPRTSNSNSDSGNKDGQRRGDYGDRSRPAQREDRPPRTSNSNSDSGNKDGQRSQRINLDPKPGPSPISERLAVKKPSTETTSVLPASDHNNAAVPTVHPPVATVPEPVTKKVVESPKKAVVEPQKKTDVIPSGSGRPSKAFVFDSNIGDKFILTLVSKSDFYKGYIESDSEVYSSLLEPMAANCMKEAVLTSLEPGILACVLYQDAWYRAVYYPPEGYALIDMGAIVPEVSEVRNLPSKYKTIPEFAFEMKIVEVEGKNIKVDVPATYSGKVESKGAVLTASLYPYNPENPDNIENPICTIKIRQWKLDLKAQTTPTAAVVKEVAATAAVASSAATTAANPAAAPPPKVETAGTALPRDAVEWATIPAGSDVNLLHFGEDFSIFLRLADPPSAKKHDQIVQNTANYYVDSLLGDNNPALSTPPNVGDTVIAKFGEEPYRAVILEANPIRDLYKVQYVDYGNEECVCLKDLSALNEELRLLKTPLMTARYFLRGRGGPGVLRRPKKAVLDYTKVLIEGNVTLKCVSIENGEAVLKNTDSGEMVNTIIEKYHQLEWKKLKEAGTSIYNIDPLMHEDNMESCTHLMVPRTRLKLQKYMLESNTILATFVDDSMEYLCNELQEYCEDAWAGDKYLPRENEACFVKCEDGKWRRGSCLKIEKIDETIPGVRVVLADSYRDILAPLENVRKAVNDYYKGLPLHITLISIKGLPKKLSSADVIKHTADYFTIVNDEITLEEMPTQDDESVFSVSVSPLITELKELKLI